MWETVKLPLDKKSNLWYNFTRVKEFYWEVKVMNGKRNINTYLDDTQWKEFEAVQRYYGIDTNVDVVRFLIRKEARKITEQAPLSAPAPGGNGEGEA